MSEPDLLPKCERYRPSNGTEGHGFIDEWCSNCERDRGGDCSILANTFVYDIDDPRYPPEWVRDEHGPRCTAFIERGKPIPVRCAHTADLFGDKA
jgi:hypothetical protein